MEIRSIIIKICELIKLISSQDQQNLIYINWREILIESMKLIQNLPDDKEPTKSILNVLDDLSLLLKRDGPFYLDRNKHEKEVITNLKELENLIESLAERKLTKETRVWTSTLDLSMPILTSDLPNFKSWINWSGFKGYSERHIAFDFAAYLDKKGNCILGLPEKTPIKAVADGTVVQISSGLAGQGVPYACFINIEHANEGSGLFSAYHHVKPSIKAGSKVKKGDIIATLYKDPGSEEEKLVHLHFELRNGWGIKNRDVDPATIFPKINEYSAEPQGKENFVISGLKRPNIIIANFKKLLLDND